MFARAKRSTSDEPTRLNGDAVLHDLDAIETERSRDRTASVVASWDFYAVVLLRLATDTALPTDAAELSAVADDLHIDRERVKADLQTVRGVIELRARIARRKAAEERRIEAHTKIERLERDYEVSHREVERVLENANADMEAANAAAAELAVLHRQRPELFGADGRLCGQDLESASK